MTRDRAKELLPILQAYADGKTIEHKHIEDCLWAEVTEHSAFPSNNYEYRIKPTEKAEESYRPFNSEEELIEEWIEKLEAEPEYKTIKCDLMLPLIWVRAKEYQTVNLIIAYDENCVFIQDVWFDLSELFDKYEFLDGTPCGVKK